MREVNNTTNSNNINFQGVQARKDVSQQAPAVESKEITDLGMMPAEVIGRSQVTKTVLDKEIEFYNKYPEKVEDLNRFCDYLVEKMGYSYEQACTLSGVAAEHFFDM